MSDQGLPVTKSKSTMSAKVTGLHVRVPCTSIKVNTMIGVTVAGIIIVGVTVVGVTIVGGTIVGITIVGGGSLSPSTLERGGAVAGCGGVLIERTSISGGSHGSCSNSIVGGGSSSFSTLED